MALPFPLLPPRQTGFDVKSFNNMGDKEKTTAFLFPLSEQLTASRSHIRQVIHQCLTETQKLHVGIAVNDPDARGATIDGLAGGVSLLACRRFRIVRAPPRAVDCGVVSPGQRIDVVDVVSVMSRCWFRGASRSFTS